MRKKPRTKRTKPTAPRPWFQPRLELLEDRSLLSAGAVDFHFGHDGVAAVDTSATVKGIAVEGDGKIVVLDQTQAGYDLVRLNTDGSLDSAFGSNGLVAATFGDGTAVVKLAVLGDSSIVVGGEHGDAPASFVDVARFNPDGTVDTAFGNGGIAEVAFGGDSSSASNITAADMAVFSSGSIVVVGATGSTMAVVYLNADGSPNNSFGSNGIVTTPLGDTAQATGVALQSDGKIVVSGFGNGELAVVRYNSDGSLDNNFGTSGIASASLPGTTFEGSRVAVDSITGKVVVTADSFTVNSTYDTISYGQDYSNLLRFNDDGSVDSGFAGNGQAGTSSWWGQLPANPIFHNLALQDDGKILVAGDYWGTAEVTRYNVDGSADLTYGNGGTATTSWSAWNETEVPALALQGDGQVVVASDSTTWDGTTDSTNVVATRFQADSDLRPTQFGSDAAFKEYLIDQAVQQYSWYFGRQETYWPIEYAVAGIAMSPGVATASAAATTTGNTFSQTNTQVQGVDEGDTVKTDGQYLYILSGGQLVILNAWPADQLQIVSETTLTGNSLVEYLDGNRLTVISQTYQQNYFYPGGAALVFPFYRMPSQVDVTVYDVSDPSAPAIVQQNTLDGTYDSSRAIGNTVYVAVNSYLNLPMPAYTIENTPVNSPTGVLALAWGSTLIYETEAAYRARLEAMPLDAFLPQYTTQWTDAGGAHETSGLLTTAADIYQPGVPDDTNLMSVVSFDMGGSSFGPTHSVSFLTSYGATLYAATDNFYLISSQWSYVSDWTFINQISLQDGGLQFTATGRVPGTTLNQFSVGEDGAYLDIATTTGWGTDASANVYVLGENDGTLDIVGSLDNLAPGEQIYSVWFMGDRGFVSTFQRVDPLFALDLSDPTAPRVAGTLEMSGYNSYLQPLDATHLLGIGQDVNPATNEPDGLVLSLFDVSDLNNPTLVSRYEVAPNGWSWSQAQYDYHAITYYPQFQALTLPLDSDQYVSSADGSGGQWVYQNAQLVFHVDLTGGTLSLQGTVTDSSEIQRGVFINNVLYSISDTSVQAHSLDDLTTLIAQVQLPAPTYYGWWGGPILYPILVGVPILLPVFHVNVIAVVTPVKVDPVVPPVPISTGTPPVTDPAPVSSPTPVAPAQPVSQPAGPTDTTKKPSVVVKHAPTTPVHHKPRISTPARKAAVVGLTGEPVQNPATTVLIGLGAHGPAAAPISHGGQATDLSPPLDPAGAVVPQGAFSVGVGSNLSQQTRLPRVGKKQGEITGELDTVDTSVLE